MILQESECTLGNSELSFGWSYFFRSKAHSHSRKPWEVKDLLILGLHYYPHCTLTHWRFFLKLFRVLRWPPGRLCSYKQHAGYYHLADKVLLRIKWLMYPSVAMVKPEEGLKWSWLCRWCPQQYMTHGKALTVCQLLCRSPKQYKIKIEPRNFKAPMRLAAASWFKYRE